MSEHNAVYTSPSMASPLACATLVEITKKTIGLALEKTAFLAPRLFSITAFVTLQLTACGGGGGGVSEGSADPNSGSTQGVIAVTSPQVSVAHDIQAISYPTSYTSPVAINSVSLCDIGSTSSIYPNAWLNSRALPQVVGAPLDARLQTSISIKDILPDGSLPSECSNPDNLTQFTRTLSRLKAINTDIVTIIQWHWAKINLDGSFSITGDTGGALSDSQLSQYVAAAHAAGIKVMLTNQIQGFVNQSETANIPTPSPSPTTYQLWMDAFGSYMLNRAPFFQSLGVDFWEMGCNSCVYGDDGDGGQSATAIFVSAYESILPRVSAIYKGMRYMASHDELLTSVVLSNLDYLNVGFWSSVDYSATTESAIDVATYKSNLRSGVPPNLKYGKPLLIDLGIQSRWNALSVPGYEEETACTNSIGTVIYPTSCVQQNTTTDLALQAIVIEAEFEILASQSMPNGSIVRVSDYWQTDFVNQNNQGPTFPNLGMSIRNKPAEYIVNKWFSRVN